MEGMWKPGSLVRHATLGLGKIIHGDGAGVHVYFPEKDGLTAKDRVARFRDPSTYLTPAPSISHPELDNLPPWDGSAFRVATNSVDVTQAIERFLHLFPGGIDDPKFLQHEIAYKRAAHRRWIDGLASRVSELAQSKDGDLAAGGIDAVYGSSRPGPGEEPRLNLLYQRIEEQAYFEALGKGQVATTEYLSAASTFVLDPNEANFEALASALRSLPTRSGGTRLDMWTTITWLPFIADPLRHIIIKPTIMQSFAAAIPFEIHYRSELNFRTYRSCVEMARLLGDKLEKSAINLGGRRFDMIDIQSFMWVVERWESGRA